MDRLSSCYFCGAALDASLSEYPVVPAELRPDDDQQRTVVLCPTCQRKLGQVVETVVDAVDGRSDADGDSGSDAVSEPGQSDASGTVEGDSNEDFGWTSSEDAVERDSAGGSGEGLLGGAADDGPDRDGGRSDSREEARNSRSDAGRSVDGGAASRRRENGTADAGTDDPNGSARRHGRSERSADDGDYADGRSAADVASERSGPADEGTDDPTDGEPSLTRLEYNKVMRLLQNREFPVDRAEIRAVATNAYEISDDEFERIIDAAVEHDLIDERNGQLVQAD